MSRLDKKCLVASSGMHVILLLLVVFSTAFVVPSRKKSLDVPMLKVVPTKLIDQALAGGGGNPNLPPSDALEKGNTLKPVPPEPTPAPPPQPRSTPPPATPPAEPRKADSRKATVPPAKKTSPLAMKDTAKSDSAVPILKPMVRSTADKRKAQADAEAQEQAAATQRIGQRLARAAQGLKAGFESGTEVEASGPGGFAYMNYAAWVKQVFEEAWIVGDDFSDDSSTVRAVVTIARDGRVISAYIDKESRNPALDRSVRFALNRVKTIGHSFPEGAREDTRTFTINFNLKSKRSTG